MSQVELEREANIRLASRLAKAMAAQFTLEAPLKKGFKKRPPLSTLQSPVIRLEAGNPPVCFNVHKDLMRFHSSYFRGALDNGFAETNNNVIKLEDDDPEVVNVFVRWAYFGELCEPKEISFSATAGAEEETTVNPTKLILLKTWVFGDKRGIPELQNLCLGEIHERSPFQQTFQLNVPFIYDNTLAGSELRQYIVEFVALAPWRNVEYIEYLMAVRREDQKWNTEIEFFHDLTLRVLRIGGPQEIAKSRASRGKV